MLRVTIEVVPHGIEDAKRTLEVVEIANDGHGTEEWASYIMRTKTEPQWVDAVYRHTRTYGWLSLVIQALTTLRRNRVTS